MKNTQNGNALVEFLFVAPLFIIFFFLVLDMSLVIVQQFSLERATQTLARKLALSPAASMEALQAQAQSWLSRRFREETTLDLRARSLPTLPSSEGHRQKKEARLLEITTQQAARSRLGGTLPLTLKSHIRQLRVDIP